MVERTTIRGCCSRCYDHSRPGGHYCWIHRVSCAGFWGANVAALATFIPCCLSTVIPAPYFKKYGKNPAIKTFVDGVTAAAIGAIAGAVLVLGKRTLTDIPTLLIAIATAAILLRFKKLQEPYVIIVAALIGILLKTWL